MATVVDALLVTLGVDSSGVDRGMNQAQERINSGVKNIVSALSAPIMAALAGFSAGAAVSAYTEAATSLDRLSQSLGMSMETLQGWQYAAEAAGAEAQEVGKFFRDMSDKIVDATTFDGGPLKDIAKELGISLKDAQGNIKATEDVTLELADAFQKAGNQKAVAFGMKLGLDPGMIALLQKGRGEIEALIKAQKELGVYTKKDAEIASKARFAFMTLGRSIEAATMPIARVVVPAITWLAERFTAVANLIRKNSQFVEVTLGVLAAVITARFIPSLYAMGAAGLTAMLPFAPLIALVAGLALVIDDLIAYINGGDSALAWLWSKFGTGEEISNKLKAAWNDLKVVGEALWGGLKIASDLFWKSVERWTKTIKKWLQPILDMFGAISDGIKKVMPEKTEVMKHLETFEYSGDPNDYILDLSSKDAAKTAAAEAIPGAAYNSAINNRTANVTKKTTINGGIHITGASDPQASGKAVSEAIRDNDDDLSFAADTGVRQ